MSARIPWEPALAGVAAIVLAGSIAWFSLDVIEAQKAHTVGYNGPPFQALSAALPKIAEFERFYINEENPFVPYQVRALEAKHNKEPRQVVIKPRPPAQIKTVDPPKLDLPTRPTGGGDAPKVLGFHHRRDQPSSAVVQIPGEAAPRTMAPGDKAGRWTFLTIENGNIAKFRDADGREYAVVIGR